jgi:hypothetical protein
MCELFPSCHTVEQYVKCGKISDLYNVSNVSSVAKGFALLKKAISFEIFYTVRHYDRATLIDH